MSSKILHQGPCPVCPSSDAFTEYEDGGAYCFSCGHHIYGDTTAPRPAAHESPVNIVPGVVSDLPSRGLYKASMSHYGV